MGNLFRPKKTQRPESLALVYHATFEEPPADLKLGLHNVPPRTLREQLVAVQKHYRFVEIDQYLSAKSRSGWALLTFDDAYRCVFEQALPILEDLEIPCAMFVNGTTLEGKTLWRDRVRFIINHGLVDHWERFRTRTRRLDGEDFYRYTKNPCNRSDIVDEELNAFLTQRGLLDQIPRYCVSDRSELPDHPLITYGNHTHDHYVLASLPPDLVQHQVKATKRVLDGLAGLNKTRALSVPFGDPPTYNTRLLEVAAGCGCSCLLLTGSSHKHSETRRRKANCIFRHMPFADTWKDQLHTWN
ncbi:MAG: polysaccharide deacetylase family protein [Pirellulaceae bacterium]